MRSIKKRLLSLLLTLITILSLLPTSALAASGTGKGITITKDQAYWSTRLLANGTPYSYRPPMAAGRLLYCLDSGLGYHNATQSFFDSYTYTSATNADADAVLKTAIAKSGLGEMDAATLANVKWLMTYINDCKASNVGQLFMAVQTYVGDHQSYKGEPGGDGDAGGYANADTYEMYLGLIDWMLAQKAQEDAAFQRQIEEYAAQGMVASIVESDSAKWAVFALSSNRKNQSFFNYYGPRELVVKDTPQGGDEPTPPVGDADITLKLKNVFEPKLKEEGCYDLFREVEMPLMPVLAWMERNGVCIDTEALKETSALYTKEMNRLEEEIHALAGEPFNIASPKQVGEVLFEKLKISEKPKKTKTGQYVTSEEVLETLRTRHPIVEKILEHRGLKKLLGTYIDALPKLINPETGHIHTSFNQTITTTGRLSSSNPNLQNIPVRNEEGKEIRKAFIPEAGCEFFSADYSQIELRIMAHLSGDPHMIEAFREGHDIHAATAAKIYKKPLEEVTREERSKAKTANFGIIYGITVFGLAERMNVSRAEAKELIDGYFITYPKVKEYMQKSIETAREKGYTETIYHRKCYLRDINSHNAVVRGYAERNAINAPIQGSAADIIKIAMIAIYRRFREEHLRSKMILQVHDELNFSVYPEEKERVQQIVIEEMERAYAMQVPLEADYGWGRNWLEAH